jgi:hypothetical protein
MAYRPSGKNPHDETYKAGKKKKETWVDRGKRATKAMLGLNGKVDRGAQFRNYLALIDRLSKKRVNLARGFVADPGEKLTATAGRINTVGRTVPGTSISMSKILDQYHDRALRLAQAKYYQRQAKT